MAKSGRIRRIIELILDPISARRAELSLKESLRRGTDPKDPTRRLGTIEKSLLRLRVTALALGATLTGALAFGLRKIARESTEAQAVQAQLAARIQSTGGAAGRTTDQLNEQAEALSRVTTFSDDVIGSAQSLLLTFTRVRGEVFDQTTEAALDMATALGTDLNTSIQQLGKALNDPIRGIAQLRRNGIQFTQSQEDLIKSLVETNRLAEAQGIILDEVSKKYGGAAEAARNTLGGALQGLANAWNNLFEVSQESTSGIIGAINRLSNALPGLRREIDEELDKTIKNWERLAKVWRFFFGGAKEVSFEIGKITPVLQEQAAAAAAAAEAEEARLAAAKAAEEARKKAAEAAAEAADKQRRAEDERLGLLVKVQEAWRLTGGELKELLDIERDAEAALARGNLTIEERARALDRMRTAAEALQPGRRDVSGQIATGVGGISAPESIGTRITQDVENSGVNEVASGLQSVFDELFGSMEEGSERAGLAFVALAELLQGSFEGAIGRIASMKATEMLAQALEEGARAIGALAVGNFASAAAHGRSALGFGAAAAAYKGLAGVAGGGGGGAGGGSAAGLGIGGNAVGSATDGVEAMAPHVTVIVDGIDPDNPKHIQLVQRTVINARQQWGDQKPSSRRYARSVG